jgi:hypothetical protein
MLLTLSIPDADRAFMTQLIADRGYTVVENDTPNPEWEVPDWHKEIVRQKRAMAKPEDYVPLEEVLKAWGME